MSPIHSTLLPIQSTLLPVWTGHSNTVDFQQEDQSRPCWIQLCCQCVPGLSSVSSVVFSSSSLSISRSFSATCWSMSTCSVTLRRRSRNCCSRAVRYLSSTNHHFYSSCCDIAATRCLPLQSVVAPSGKHEVEAGAVLSAGETVWSIAEQIHVTFTFIFTFTAPTLLLRNTPNQLIKSHKSWKWPQNGCLCNNNIKNVF